MKKNLMTLAAVLCCMISTTALTSCLDKVDNAVPQEPTMIDPVVDNYLKNSDVNRNVHPGESFYDFAVGSWVKNHDPKDLCWIDEGQEYINSIAKKALTNSTDPQIKHLVSNLYSTPDAEKELQAIEKVLNVMFDENGNYNILRGWGQLADMGYLPPVARVVTMHNNLFYYTITAGVNSYEQHLRNTGDMIKLRIAMKNCLAPFVKDTDELYEWVDKVKAISDKAWAARNSQLTGSLMERLQGEKLPQYSLDNAMKGRRAGSIGFTPERVAEYYGLDFSRDRVDAQSLAFFDELENADPRLLFMYTAYNIMMQNYYYMIALQRISLSIEFDYVYSHITFDVPALINVAEAEAFAPVVNQQECLADLERLRVKMAQRIRDLDWMTDATKEAALQKLQKMRFYAGVPEELIVKDAFNLTGETFLEDMMQARAQASALVSSYVGKPSYGNFHVGILTTSTLSEINAFYSRDFNSVCILPAFCSKVMYPQSDAKEDLLRRYATSYVFAHELCHGFDARGSQYDGEGYAKDWWDPSDKQKFEAKQQQMIDRFDELWAYQGQHANGEYTLAENMADLGGVRLAFEIFKDVMAEQGYYGEAYKHMLREFFMHYAQVWKEDDRGLAGYIEQYYYDNHSTSANRINGITRIMDEWYDLFQVKSGGIYVAPADRPHIW